MEPEQPADPTWKAAAERARAMSEQWRSLHEAEEARANEARAYAARAGAAAKRAEQERDTALKKAERAERALAAAKQEQAQWRARSDAQTAAKTFLQLEEARDGIRERDAALTAAARDYDALHLEFSEFKAAKKREAIEREALQRDKMDTLQTKHLDAVSQSRALENALNRVRGELGGHLASSPPGHLDALKADCEKMQGYIRQLEAKNTTLRREVIRWRDRARGAIAGEKLLQLQSGPVSMPMPARANLEATLKSLSQGLGGVTATPGATADGPLGVLSGGPMRSGLLSPRSLLEQGSIAGSDLDGGGGPEAEQLKLRSELEHCQEELKMEREREELFQRALWADTIGFTQQQKLKLMEMLRNPPPPPPPVPRPPSSGGGLGGRQGSGSSLLSPRLSPRAPIAGGGGW